MSSDRGGIELAGVRCGWALDGGALHLYRFEGDVTAIGALVNEAQRIAHRLGAAVCVATLDSEDRWVEPLVACGFERDETEPYVRNGEVRMEVTLLRVL